jgi:hypothetical protein
MKKLLLIAAGIVLLYVGLTYSPNNLFEKTANTAQVTQGPVADAAFSNNQAINNQTIQAAFDNHKSNVQVEGKGIVVRLLPDDNQGARHQKFIVKVNPDQTLLVAHNIDLAPRIVTLTQGDEITFSGEYEWSSKGGTVHWTHHDTQGQHVGGWIRHNGQTYQ